MKAYWRLWSFISLLLVYNLSQAQDFSGGIFLGLTASQIDGDSYSGFNKPGITAGVFIQHPFSPILEGDMEIRYSMRGAKNPKSDDQTGLYVLTLHYMDVPITLAVKIKGIFSIEGGIIPGFLFASGARDDYGSLPDDYVSEIRKFDLGSSLGCAIALGPKFFFRIRYSYSILSIRNLQTAGASYSWFGKLLGHTRGDFNNYITAGLYYRIR